jgi:hypothetical protein
MKMSGYMQELLLRKSRDQLQTRGGADGGEMTNNISLRKIIVIL